MLWERLRIEIKLKITLCDRESVNYFPHPPPPLYFKKDQDCVVEGTRCMSVQFYDLIRKQKQNIERTHVSPLPPPNMYFLAG